MGKRCDSGMILGAAIPLSSVFRMFHSLFQLASNKDGCVKEFMIRT